MPKRMIKDNSPLEMSSSRGAFLMLYYMLLKTLDGGSREIDAQKVRFGGSFFERRLTEDNSEISNEVFAIANMKYHLLCG